MTHHLIVPYHFLKFSLVRIMLLHTCSDIVWSLYLMLVFQASHVNDDVEWPKPDQNNQLHKDWAVLQVESSMDFAHGDFLTTILTGSLNYQSVHHLFPQVSYLMMSIIFCVETKLRCNIDLTVLLSWNRTDYQRHMCEIQRYLQH